MKPDQFIEIQLVDRSGRFAEVNDVLVEVQLFTGGNYRYGFKVGRTDEAGHLTISANEIDDFRRARAQENLMDYNTSIEECNQTIKVLIPPEQQLRAEYENVIRLYELPPEWAIPWPANGRVAAKEMMVTLTEPATVAQVVVYPIGSL